MPKIMTTPEVRLARLMSGAAGLALLCGLGTPALAQTAADDTTIIVTAQKREQKLQDVPIVVTTLSAKLMQNAGVRDVKDMQILTPGMTVTSSSSEASTTVRIRGVGTVGDNAGLESSVGIVIDGVYRPRNSVGFGDLGELERTEILKGPQGTLFGKNTSAGVINVITKKPSFTFGAEGEATFGNYGAQGYAASVTGPLIADELAGRLYIAHRTRDGFTHVKTGAGPRTLTNDGNQDYTTVRGQLLATPSAAMTIRIIADYSKRDEMCCGAVQVRTGPTAGFLNLLAAGALATPANMDARTAYSNRNTQQRVRDGGLSAEFNYDLANGTTVTSITAGRAWKATKGADLDFTTADIWYRKDNGDFADEFKNFSQEVRWAGSNDRLTWMIGGFYTNETLTSDNSWWYGPGYEPYLSLLLTATASPLWPTPTTNQVAAFTGLAPGASYVSGTESGHDVYTQKSNSIALFTNESFKVTEALELTVGLRYTSEKKTLDTLQTNPDGANACTLAQARSAANTGVWAFIPLASRPTILTTLCLPWANRLYNSRATTQESEDNKLTGTVKAAYRWNPGLMTYLSYARGYKGAGYNLDRAPINYATPETSTFFAGESADSYELGMKAGLLDKRLQVNVAAFDQKYTNFQLNTYTGTGFTVTSIPELTSKGVDADVYWATPIKGLSLQGGVTLSDTKYSPFTAAQLTNPALFPNASLLPGAQMSFAPKTSASLAITWTGSVGGLRTSANLAAKHNSAYNTGSDLLPYKMQDAFTLVNGRISVGAADQRWTLELWGQNLTDEVYKQVAFNAPLQGTAFQSTVQAGGSHPGTYYDLAKDTQTYNAFLGAPRTYGVTLRVRY